MSLNEFKRFKTRLNSNLFKLV